MSSQQSLFSAAPVVQVVGNEHPERPPFLQASSSATLLNSHTSPLTDTFSVSFRSHEGSVAEDNDARQDAPQDVQHDAHNNVQHGDQQNDQHGARENPRERITQTISRAYLQARVVDQEFERDIDNDREDRGHVGALHQPVNGQHRTIPPLSIINDGVTNRAQQRHFLTDGNLSRTDGPYYYFGIEPQLFEGEGEFSDEAVTDIMCAQCFASQPFKLIANFSPVATDRYTLFLKAKQVRPWVAARFSVRVLVRYAEEKMVKSYYTRFYKDKEDTPLDEHNGWFYLKAEGLFEVRPHVGTAHVNIHITADNTFHEQSGQLWVRSLELVPYGQARVNLAMQCFSRPSQANYSFSVDCVGDTRAIVTRLAVSKDGAFLAALIQTSEHFIVQVWRASELTDDELKSLDSGKFSKLGYTTSPIPLQAQDQGSQDLLDLAISATGEYAAVFSTPKIDHWYKDSKVPTSTVGVKLFHRPHQQQLFVPADPPRLEPLSLPPIYNDAVGYATFVDRLEASAIKLPHRFVFCNGLYIDIFKLNGKHVEHSNTISLVDMDMTVRRITACKLMMQSIVTNMFVWFEDHGRSCSTWNLSNGSAIGRIEVSGLHYGDTNTTTVRVASSQNITAIVGYDNSITTIDASSGMQISRQTISDRTVESIAFPSAKSQMLLVTVRGEQDTQQTVLIFDPLRLEVQDETREVPPLSRSTVFGLHDTVPWPRIGTVCRADGHLIHFFTCNEPARTARNDHTTPVLGSSFTQYDLKLTAPTLRRSAGIGKRHALQVEIWKKGSPDERIFTFTPEPWEQKNDLRGEILSTGDRFVIHGSKTIQVWSLPTDVEPRCRLLFFWCSNPVIQEQETWVQSEREIVLERYRRLTAHTQGHQHRDGSIHFDTTVSLEGCSNRMNILIPSSNPCYYESRYIFERCLNGIWILALIHSVVSSSPDRDTKLAGEQISSNKDHALAIVDFVNSNINYSIDSTTETGRTIMAALLKPERRTKLGAKFVTALLQDNDCPWIPYNELLDPLATAIDGKYPIAIRTILDYCARKTSVSYPTFTMPVERSLEKLVQGECKELLADFFKKSAYIGAQQVDFNQSDVVLCTSEWSVLWRTYLYQILPSKIATVFEIREQQISDYKSPIITCQLNGNDIAKISIRTTEFSRRDPPLPIQKRHFWKVYAAPFPSLLAFGEGSLFRQVAGKNHADSPVIMAILKYKWQQYGRGYWLARYIVLLLFYGIFLALTIEQIHTSAPLLAEPAKLYLRWHWLGLIIADFVLGAILMVLEAIQFVGEGLGHYLGSPFNYIDVGSITLTITSLIITLQSQWTAMDSMERPPQCRLTSIALVGAYLHLITEVRAFEPPGKIVNLIVQIIKRIRVFFVILIMVIIGFSHGLIHLLDVDQPPCKEDDVEKCKAKYPREITRAFTTTLFFLAGRYDPANDEFEKEDAHYLFLMILFYVFAGIVMLNLLIAIMNDAFNAAWKDGGKEWRKQLSSTLVEAEMVIRIFHRVYPLEFPNPGIIYYLAPTQQANEFKRSLREQQEEGERSCI